MIPQNKYIYILAGLMHNHNSLGLVDSYTKSGPSCNIYIWQKIKLRQEETHVFKPSVNNF